MKNRTEKIKHTPIPWKTPAVTINDKDNNVIAICCDRANEENKANAKAIVRAINSHQILLSLVKDFGDYLNDNYDEENAPLMDNINWAISQAEKE